MGERVPGLSSRAAAGIEPNPGGNNGGPSPDLPRIFTGACNSA